MRELHMLIRRGVEDKLPNLKEGEFGLTTDTRRLFIGTSEGNIEITKLTQITDVLTAEVNTLNQRIDQEVTTLNDRVDTEVNTLNQRVETLNDRVDNEVSTLSNRVDNEVNTLNQTITTKDTAQSDALTAHKNSTTAHGVDQIVGAESSTSAANRISTHKNETNAHDVSKITNAESVTGSQTKADAARDAAKTYSDSQLNTHKTSSDHDGRYYTETEIDGKVSTINTAIGTKANSADVYNKTETLNKAKLWAIILG